MSGSERRTDGGASADGGTSAGAGGGASAGADSGSGAGSLPVILEELRRRNRSAVAIDVLYLFATAFLATLAVRGFWPAVLAAPPLAAFLYFAWKSSRAFLLTNLAVIALTVGATEAGYMPF